MNNEDKPTRRLSRYNTRRSSIGNVHKPYEHLLLKELPGAKRSNAAMHAVLESALEDNMNDSIHEAQKVRNHALIHYLASLANSNNNDDIFDFDFVQSLIENGADVNSTDKSGQSIFHEVARSWNLDVALFLLEHGADLNQQDKFGRSPLHVAAAVDYSDMVRFLVKHGANINITTYGEEQMPIHFAAKNDACKSLKMLLGYGANIDSRDSKNRTPLQVAAEMNRAKSAKLLVQHGAPAGVHDNMGNSALSLLIEKLPDVAIEALDQFHSVSSINRKEFFFLNYLEGNRLQDPKSPAYSALEIAVQNQEFDIILHPVMKRLIDVKWQQFGRNGAVSNLGLNLLYAILWTILGVTSTTNGDELYLPWSRKAWRLVLSGVVCLMTIDEVRRQITGTLKTRNRQKKWISWRASELEEDLSFCHPRWPQEELYLKSEIKAIRDTPLISSGDSWIYFDWFSLILILGTIASHLVFVNIDSSLSQVVHARIITVLLLVLWLRIMQYARPFEGAGPFVAIFGHIINDIVNWGILTLLITIPYACAFWITFGDVSRNPVESYSDVSSLLYELFSMIVVNDHDFEALQAADAMMARLLCGSYIALMAIINLNILIALLSDTFTRVYGNAVANAVMQRAKTILFLEKSLSRKRKRSYEEFIKNFGSPESVDLARDISANTDRDEQKAAYMLRESVQEIHNLIHERFGKQYGEGKKSDLDHIKESLEKVHEGSVPGKCGCKGVKRKVDIIQETLIKLCNSLKVDVSALENNPQSSASDDDDTLVGQIEAAVSNSGNSRSEWKGKVEDWDDGNEQGRNSRQPFWSVNKAALDEEYQMEMGEPVMSRKFRRTSSINRGRENIDSDQTGYKKGRDFGQSTRNEGFTDVVPRDPVVLLSYRQSRDENGSYRPRVDRREYGTNVYQDSFREEEIPAFRKTRRESDFSREVLRERMQMRSGEELRRSESLPHRASKNIPENTYPRRVYYSATRAKKSHPRNLKTNSLRGPERRESERRDDRQPYNVRESRAPERRSQFPDRSDSDVVKPRQQSSDKTNTYPRTRSRDSPEKYFADRSQRQMVEPTSQSDTESDDSDMSQKASFRDNQNAAYSDNDLIAKRAKRFREKRFLDDWDTRSVKSVAF